jgi:hypothetical protein
MAAIVEFAKSFPRFVAKPRRFLAQADLDGQGSFEKTWKFLGLGLALTFIVSAINLRLSPPAHLEEIEKMFDQTTVDTALTLSTVALLILSYFVFKILGSQASLRKAANGLGLTLAYLWPLTCIVLVLMARIVSSVSDVPWVVIPPFTASPLEPIDSTVPNLVAISCAIVINLALLIFGLYAYFTCFRVTHALSRGRTVAGLALIALAFIPIGKIVALFSFWLIQHLGPAWEQLLRLFK